MAAAIEAPAWSPMRWKIFSSEEASKLDDDSSKTLEAIRRRRERKTQAELKDQTDAVGHVEAAGPADLQSAIQKLEETCESQFLDVQRKLDALTVQVSGLTACAVDKAAADKACVSTPLGATNGSPNDSFVLKRSTSCVEPGILRSERHGPSKHFALPRMRLPRFKGHADLSEPEPPPPNLPSMVHDVMPPPPPDPQGNHPWLEPKPPWASEAGDGGNEHEPDEPGGLRRAVSAVSTGTLVRQATKDGLVRNSSESSIARNNRSGRGGSEHLELPEQPALHRSPSDRSSLFQTIQTDWSEPRSATPATVSGLSRRGSLVSATSSAGLDMLRARLAVRRRRGPCAQRLWQFMEEADSSTGAMWFSWLLPSLIFCNSLFCFVQTTETAVIRGSGSAAIHVAFDMLFLVEVTVRFLVCPNRIAFFCNTFNWIDLVSALPIFYNVPRLFLMKDQEHQDIYFNITVLLPVVRLLKVLRSFEKFHLLQEAFWMAFEALPVLLYTLSLIIISFSVVLYFTEKGEGGGVNSLPQAMWLAIVTMMTVGYGDVVPRTPFGHIVIGVLIIISALYMAVPLGIVGGSFSRVWEDRDRLMLIRRTRIKLLQCGYGPKDILELFYLYDSNKSGELDLGQFNRMISDMQLGIGTERVVNLFKTFDSDGSGKVDDEEFVRALYPKAYHIIYPDLDGPGPASRAATQEPDREQEDEEAKEAKEEAEDGEDTLDTH